PSSAFSASGRHPRLIGSEFSIDIGTSDQRRVKTQLRQFVFELIKHLFPAVDGNHFLQLADFAPHSVEIQSYFGLGGTGYVSHDKMIFVRFYFYSRLSALSSINSYNFHRRLDTACNRIIFSTVFSIEGRSHEASCWWEKMRRPRACFLRKARTRAA